MAKKPAIEFDEKPQPKTVKIKQWLSYKFTHEELHQMGLDLARHTEAIGSLTTAKEQIVADFKAKITKEEAECSGLSLAINKGFEFRNIECEVAWHTPENGKKTITRLDTGEVVDVTFMDAHEMQEQLPLQTEEVTP